MKKNFLVQLLTARRNYDVAEILQNKAILSYLVTDFYRGFLSKYIMKAIPWYSYVYNAYNNHIPSDLVKRNLIAGVLYRLKLKVFPKDNYGSTLESYKLLSKNSIRLINRDKNINSVYAYDTGAFELFEYIATNKTNVKSLFLEQCVAPRSAQMAMYKKFTSLYGVDYSQEITSCEKLHIREKKEWDLATKIIVPSNYVRNEIIKCGINPEKIVIVPYGYSAPYSFSDIKKHIKDKWDKKSEKIIVLYVGNGGYRKGVLDLLEVANNLNDNRSIEFRIAGNMGGIVSDIHKPSENVKFLGVLDKKRLYQEYLNADIYILPSYLEGSAMSIQEALSFGLPVVTTFESGSFISNNKEGFVFHAGDIDGMSQALHLLVLDDTLRYKMANNALNLMSNNTLKDYQINLLSVLMNN